MNALNMQERRHIFNIKYKVDKIGKKTTKTHKPYKLNEKTPFDVFYLQLSLRIRHIFHAKRQLTSTVFLYNFPVNLNVRKSVIFSNISFGIVIISFGVRTSIECMCAIIN